jgi:hypothetical protein
LKAVVGWILVKIARKLNLKILILVQVIKCTINDQIWIIIEDVRLYLNVNRMALYLYCISLLKPDWQTAHQMPNIFRWNLNFWRMFIFVRQQNSEDRKCYITLWLRKRNISFKVNSFAVWGTTSTVSLSSECIKL